MPALLRSLGFLLILAVPLGAAETDAPAPGLLYPRSPSFPANPGFQEAWGYLLAGDEGLLKARMPLSDIGHFGAEVNSYGELVRVPVVEKLKAFRGRKHLVFVLLSNYAQAHLILDPNLPIRARFTADLVKAAQGYDGLQLDIEAVPDRDKAHFWSLLSELKSRLGSKILSVAIPARTRKVDDAYDYRILNGIVDRIILMAYDEHWSGSKPGSVASPAWCQQVTRYAQTVISPEKLVMGNPFYGRAWADKSLSKAYVFSGVDRIRREKRLTPPSGSEATPWVEYEEKVKVKLYYEDRDSVWRRLGQYALLGVRNVAFWRVGQEDPGVWKVFHLSR